MAVSVGFHAPYVAPPKDRVYHIHLRVWSMRAVTILLGFTKGNETCFADEKGKLYSGDVLHQKQASDFSPGLVGRVLAVYRAI